MENRDLQLMSEYAISTNNYLNNKYFKKVLISILRIIIINSIKKIIGNHSNLYAVFPHKIRRFFHPHPKNPINFNSYRYNRIIFIEIK